MSKDVPRSRRVILCVLLVLFTACQTWEPTVTNPRDLISQEEPSSIRVTRTDGDVVTIKSPVFRNDSIVSIESGPVDGARVASSDIGFLEVKRFQARRTVVFVVAAVVVGLAWAKAAAGNSSGGSGVGDPPLPKGPS